MASVPAATPSVRAQAKFFQNRLTDGLIFAESAGMAMLAVSRTNVASDDGPGKPCSAGRKPPANRAPQAIPWPCFDGPPTRR